MNNELQRGHYADPRYPILMEIPGQEDIRLSRDVETRLIQHAANAGVDFKSISTWDDYLFATLVASESEEEAVSKRKTAEELLAKIFSQAQ